MIVNTQYDKTWVKAVRKQKAIDSIMLTKASHGGINSHWLRRRLLPLSPFSAPHIPPPCPLTPIPVTAGTTATVEPDEVCHPA